MKSWLPFSISRLHFQMYVVYLKSIEWAVKVDLYYQYRIWNDSVSALLRHRTSFHIICSSDGGIDHSVNRKRFVKTRKNVFSFKNAKFGCNSYIIRYRRSCECRYVNGGGRLSVCQLRFPMFTSEIIVITAATQDRSTVLLYLNSITVWLTRTYSLFTYIHS